MGSKTISLDEEAYSRLKQEKKDKESFSDVVKRITRPMKQKSLLEFAGIWQLSIDEWETMQHALADLRSQFDDLFG
ncbi:MAG: antitoxin VapB family protein [Candidatus Heimdallarchaeota archaeon]